MYAQLLVFYKRANILDADWPGLPALLWLDGLNPSHRKIPIARRGAASAIDKLTSMDEMPTTTFGLWLTNAEMVIKNAGDLTFLRPRETDRAVV